MIVRTACLEGSVQLQDIDRLDALVATEIVPLMKRFPGVQSIRVLRALSIEDDGPRLHLTFESAYESEDAMRQAFLDPVRQELKAKLALIAPWFTGRLFHITQKLIADERMAEAEAG